MWVRSLGQEDPLNEGMATHSSILVWRIPWTEGPGRLRSMGSQRVGHDWSDSAHALMRERERASTSSIEYCIHFLGNHKILPQHWWLTTTEIYYLLILETRRLKSSYGQGSAPSANSGEDSVLCLIQLLGTATTIPPPSIFITPSLCAPLLLCLYRISICLSLIRMSVIQDKLLLSRSSA